jgi:hypothetical protein
MRTVVVTGPPQADARDAEALGSYGVARAKGQAWGLKTIASFHSHGTPPVAEQTAAEAP